MEGGDDESSVLATETAITGLSWSTYLWWQKNLDRNQQVEKLSIPPAGSSWPFIHRPELNQPGGLDTKKRDLFYWKDQLFSYQVSVQVALFLRKAQAVLILESSSPNISRDKSSEQQGIELHLQL